MGYHMDQIETKFFIPWALHRPALDNLKARARAGIGMRRVMLANGQHGLAYDAVNAQELFDAKTLEEAIELFCWRPVLDSAGNIIDIEQACDKICDSETLFAGLGPWVEAGGYIEMRGDDGDIWRWVFDGAECRKVIPRIIWDD